jgi:hypothetical protein
VGLVVGSSIALIGLLAAAVLGVLHHCQTRGNRGDNGQGMPAVAPIAIVGAMPILVLGLLISRAIELAPR